MTEVLKVAAEILFVSTLLLVSFSSTFVLLDVFSTCLDVEVIYYVNLHFSLCRHLFIISLLLFSIFPVLSLAMASFSERQSRTFYDTGSIVWQI